MTETFDGYERQFNELIIILKKRCKSVSSNQAERKEKYDELKAGLDQAESWIRRMDLEARTLLPPLKTALLTKLREYKSDLNLLKREAKNLLVSIDSLSAKNELFDSRSGGGQSRLEADQRDRLVNASDRIIRSGERIKDTRRQLIETEDLGVRILQDLQVQHQTLLHTQQTMQGADTNIAKSSRLLSSMSQRFEKHKYIMAGIIAVLFLAIMFVIYIKSHK